MIMVEGFARLRVSVRIATRRKKHARAYSYKYSTRVYVLVGFNKIRVTRWLRNTLQFEYIML